MWSANLTHNVNPIVDVCLVAGGAGVAKDGNHYADWSWGRLGGLTGAEAVPIVEKALAHATNPANEAVLAPLTRNRAWGRLEHVQKVLSELLDACRAHYAAKIRASG